MHEVRYGELTARGRLPYPNYGAIDAPLLYVLLLHQAYQFIGDRVLLERYLPVAERCLTWAAAYGDRDGDGFIEYQTASPKGLRNQGWKDSWDAVVHADGAQAEPAIALCEVQGYYYDALLRMADLLAATGDDQRAGELRARAGHLQRHFNEVFWMENEGYYAFGLDGRKRLIRSVASNAGHLLWSGIVPAERAAQVARRLMQPDLLSGWGVRTLSADHPAYGPESYHRGSVWPHDNAIIATGLKRYGFVEEANRIAEGIFAAAARFEGNTLPELFAGSPRTPDALPVLYVQANIPQAWASGSVFQFLRMLLGMEPCAETGRLHLTPTLPAWLPDLTLRDFRVLGSTLDLRITRRSDGHSEFRVLRLEGPVQVVGGQEEDHQGDLKVALVPAPSQEVERDAAL